MGSPSRETSSQIVREALGMGCELMAKLMKSRQNYVRRLNAFWNRYIWQVHKKVRRKFTIKIRMWKIESQKRELHRFLNSLSNDGVQ